MTGPDPSTLEFRRGSVDVSIATFLIGNPVAESLVVSTAITNAAAEQGVHARDVRLVKEPVRTCRDPEIPAAQRRTYNYVAFGPTHPIGDPQ